MPRPQSQPPSPVGSARRPTSREEDPNGRSLQRKDSQFSLMTNATASDTACLLRFIEEQHLMSQWHLERQIEEQSVRLLEQNFTFRKLLEEKIDKAVTDMRNSTPQALAPLQPSWDELNPEYAADDNGANAGLMVDQEDDTQENGKAMAPNAIHLEVAKASREIKDITEAQYGQEACCGCFGLATDPSSSTQAARKISRRGTLTRITQKDILGRNGLQKFVNTRMDFVLAFVIVVSTVLTCADLEIAGEKANYELGISNVPPGPSANSFFDICDYVVTVYFLFDLALRIYAFRCELIYDKLSILDAFIVVITASDSFVFKQTSDSESNMGFIRLIRYVKLVRSLRLIRTMQMFHQLRVLIHTISHSMLSLVWSMVILSACQLVSALLMVQLLHSVIIDSDRDHSLRVWLNERYGSPSKAYWTMFEMTFSGSWPSHVRPLVSEVSVLYAFFFIFYIGGVVFAIIRVITALFLKETLDQASKDAEIAINAAQKQKEDFLTVLKEIFIEADTSGDGMISWTEFVELISHHRTATYLSSLDLDFTEAEHLFQLLDDGDGLVSFEEFAGGIVRLKGHARALDVFSLLTTQKKMVQDIKTMYREITKLSRRPAANAALKACMERKNKAAESTTQAALPEVTNGPA